MMHKQFIQVVDVLATITIIALLGNNFFSGGNAAFANVAGIVATITGCAWGLMQYIRLSTAIGSLYQSYIFGKVVMFIGCFGILIGYGLMIFKQADMTEVAVTVALSVALLFMGLGSMKSYDR